MDSSAQCDPPARWEMFMMRRCTVARAGVWRRTGTELLRRCAAGKAVEVEMMLRGDRVLTSAVDDPPARWEGCA